MALPVCCLNPPLIGMSILDWQREKSRPYEVDTNVLVITWAIVSRVSQRRIREVIDPDRIGGGPGHRTE